MMNIDLRLTHVAQVETTIVSTLFSGIVPDRTTVTTISTVPCLCFQDELARISGPPHVLTGKREWFIVVPSSYHAIAEGSVFRNVVDNKSVQVLSVARAEERIIYRHYREGIRVVIFKVKPNA